MLPFILQYFLTPFFILHFETSKVTQLIKKNPFFKLPKASLVVPFK
jgi:hypothetical protein